MLTPLVGEPDGCALGLEAGVVSVGDVEGAGAGVTEVGVGMGVDVGTDTVGRGPEELSSEEGLAASEGTGAAAISAVPAP